MKDRIAIDGPDGAFEAYIARPKTSPAPSVVVLQELFGVNADIRRHCDELAERGFIAVAPDLFWRQEPGVDLSVTSEPDWQHGLRLYQAYDRDAGVRDIEATVDTVVKMPDCTGKIAVLGYCLGALMTFLTAVRYRVDAAVAYHGDDTEKYLGEVDARTDRGGRIRIITARRQPAGNGQVMNERESDKMRPSYDFHAGIRGKYVQRFAKGANVAALDRAIAKISPTCKAVNNASRMLAAAGKRHGNAKRGRRSA
jgi:dienelactone hydrolase